MERGGEKAMTRFVGSRSQNYPMLRRPSSALDVAEAAVRSSTAGGCETAAPAELTQRAPGRKRIRDNLAMRSA